ncbi:general stress protein [Paenibacillus harenae]|uniref:General stress protein 17M-like domain-containing protein n=1 Tax=Paenibacillus harenae TaxID=306543 RepID=A0ABT9U7V8_PAEHA|nr:general stress protein [Paenibacillus harenae]MDQ0115742.1 hypothetical protein [Paenibacillus harenae]
MARKIGVFESQQQVIDAIEQLEQAGFTTGELKVLAKDAEHSRRIEAESDVHADEMREMAQTDDHQYGHGYGSLAMGEAAGFGGPGTVAALGAGASGSGTALGGFPAAIAALTLFDAKEYSSSLHALGLDDEETEICSEALSEGSLVLIVETDESKSLMDKDGGPDLSRLGAAEAVFRGCGASLIVAGA